ncbi:hypothetical protein V6V47_23100 [Micromonospora sp. CPCC 205539]|uniref:hypothetical protein n=1 Tax=Micromonospora sp. CPCC 205539 TaxID=3122408 RepID=UPI002FEF1C63
MTSDDSRKITIQLWGVKDAQYADIVNAIWMQMRAVDCDFAVEPDNRADPAELDRRWDDYSQVSWEAGARRGTRQAVKAGGNSDDQA